MYPLVMTNSLLWKIIVFYWVNHWSKSDMAFNVAMLNWQRLTSRSGKLGFPSKLYSWFMCESGLKHNDFCWWWWLWQFPHLVVDYFCGEPPKVTSYRCKMVPWTGKKNNIQSVALLSPFIPKNWESRGESNRSATHGFWHAFSHWLQPSEHHWLWWCDRQWHCACGFGRLKDISRENMGLVQGGGP